MISFERVNHGALWKKEINNWIDPTVKCVWNNAMHVLHNFFGLS